MAKQLNMGEREVISQMRLAGRSPAAIARLLRRHPSTIGRELKRNGSDGRYSAVTVQRQAQERRRNRPLVRKMDQPEMNEAVRRDLVQYWSPD